MCPTLCNSMDWSMPAFPSFTISWSLLKLMSIKLVMPFNYLVLWHLLLLPSIFPSIRFFSKEPALCIRWPKYWSFSFSISPSNEYSALISFSFKIDWFDHLAIQGALKSLLPSSNASNDKICIIIYYYFMYCLLFWRLMEFFFHNSQRLLHFPTQSFLFLL